MPRARQELDDFLRGRGRYSVDAPPADRLRRLICFVLVCGFFYGAVMATYTGLAPGRYHQLIYVGLKVPLLILVTFALCLPSFFVVNAVFGLGDDFGDALHALMATQACVCVVLASLAPVTGLFYLSLTDYVQVVLLNTVMFTVACVGAQLVMRRYYDSLILLNPAHRRMLYFWFFLYAFVGIQMGWVLRPFIGDPDVPVEFFRSDAWGNAYIKIVRAVRAVAR